jgi:hypothetical protein
MLADSHSIEGDGILGIEYVEVFFMWHGGQSYGDA